MMKRKDLGSLSFLKDYGSSDSDEEAPCSKHIKRLPQIQNIRLPPPSLPTYNECRSITRLPVSDESNGKKIRNFAHEPGNWATYVYVPFDQTEDIWDLLKDLTTLFPKIELNVVEDFHVSVTRTVILRHHWIKDFTDSINEVLVTTNPFFINLSGLKIYVNENKTRTFVALKVTEGSKGLNEIVQLLDKCLANYNLPPFHKPASFHMSILWCVGDKSNELSNCFKSLPKHIEEFNFYCQVSCLRCNSGNKTFNFHITNT